MTDLFLLYTTCPDEESGQRIAESLVAGGLAACVNLIPGLTSIYRWEGRMERAREVLLLAKTTEARLPALQEAIRAGHPYELPEIIAVPVAQGLTPYLDWVREACATAP